MLDKNLGTLYCNLLWLWMDDLIDYWILYERKFIINLGDKI